MKFTGTLTALFLFLLSPTFVLGQNTAPRCTSWTGVVTLGPEENWPGGIWIHDDEYDEVQVYTEVNCDSNGPGPTIWPYADGDTLFPIPVGDQYVTWNAPECGSCYIKLTAYQVSDPSLWCSSEFTLYRPCPDDPPTCVLDPCGICNGDGSSCNGDETPPGSGGGGGDPDPTPTPEVCTDPIDECGVCGGDGSSCSCIANDTSEFAFVLDSNAKEIFRHLKGSLKRAKALSCLSPKKRNSLKRRGEEIYIDSWLFANTIPRADMQCGESIECQGFQLESLYGQIRKHSRLLVNLVKKARRRCAAKDARMNRRVRYAKRLHKQMKAYLKTLPLELNACKL